MSTKYPLCLVSYHAYITIGKLGKHENQLVEFFIKGALSGLRQFLADESSLNMMKIFLFHLKSSFRSQDI